VTTRLLAVLVGVVALLVLAVPAACARECVVARVLTPVACDAAPESRVTVVWTLTVGEDGRRRPFGG
jgi:hypothetical protein